MSESKDFEKNEGVEGYTLNDSIESTIGKFRKVLLVALALFVVAVVAVVVGIVVHSNSVESGLEKVDAIYFSLANAKADSTAEEIKKLQDTSIEQLSKLSSSSGAVSLRASMLLADLYFQQGKFEEAKDAWMKAASVKKDAYTNSIAYYNAAVCSENLNDLDSALSYYEAASDNPDFLLVDHALFSLGRTQEKKGDSVAASETYQKLNDMHPNSNWAKMAKSRLIELKLSK
ncbi:MAG: tetratricopeptide repeat protein [Treponema sp.]|nr:tetratricopeptide repeat protein [Treponema sp.]